MIKSYTCSLLLSFISFKIILIFFAKSEIASRLLDNVRHIYAGIVSRLLDNVRHIWGYCESPVGQCSSHMRVLWVAYWIMFVTYVGIVSRLLDNVRDIPIKYYISVSGGLRENKASIRVQGSVCYRGYGSARSTVLFLNFSHIMQLDICVRALERITIKKSRLFYSSECFHWRR